MRLLAGLITMNHHQAAWLGLVCVALWTLSPTPAKAGEASERCQALVQQKRFSQAAACLAGLQRKEAVEHCTEGVVHRKLARQKKTKAAKKRHFKQSLLSFSRCSKQGGTVWKEAAARYTKEIEQALKRLDAPKTRTRPTPRRPTLRRATRPLQRRPALRTGQRITQTPAPPRGRLALRPPVRRPTQTKKAKAWPWILGTTLIVGALTGAAVGIYFATRPGSSIALNIPIGS